MIGTKLSDRYEILGEIGRGGMGVVYRAMDPLLNREVAIKLISPALLTPDTEQRFQSEAQVVAQMDHPSIVSIHDFGRHEGSLFFVMPVVHGTTLRQLIRDRSLLLGEVVDIGVSVAAALDYSHGRGVVHRDIKPENIMVLREEGGVARVRVMDFGLARGSDVTRITKTGVLVGTMAYLSPEQVLGKPLDGRSDLYALGCVLYECVVNEVPFSGEMQSVLYRIVHDLPQGPRDLGVSIDPELESTILGCLAKSPDQRPGSAGELLKALRAYRSRLRDSERNRSVLLTRTAHVPRPALAPFVGREKELAELQQRLNAAVRGECQFVVLSGDAGAGKTRLLDELTALCEARKIRVLHGRLVEQEGAFPYYGFCEAFQEYFRQKEAGSSPSAVPDLADLADELVGLFPMLREVPAVSAVAAAEPEPGVAPGEHSPEDRNRIFELLARTLIRISEGSPLILLLEDLHGAEASVEALQYIVRRLGSTPTLVVGTFRSTEVDRRHPVSRMLAGFRGDRRFASVALGPLNPSEHRQFLATLMGGSPVLDDLADRLYEGTEGNPFFTKELVRSLLDSGTIVQEGSGAWTLSGGMTISADAMPATIQQAVEERIERLPEELRDLLAVAAVMGRSFDFRDLEVLTEDAADLDDAVDRLIQEGLVEEDRQSRGDRLTFSSGVVREVFYAKLSRRRRRSLHRRFATHLEQQHAGRLEGIYPQLLYHYAEGDVPEKAVEFGLLHARKSLDAFSLDEATRAARTVLEFLDPQDWDGGPGPEGEARMLLASALRLAGSGSAALKEINAAIKAFEEEGDPRRTLEALVAGARTAWQARQIDETGRWVERGIEAARGVEDHDALRELLSLATTLANLRSDYEKAAAYLEEAERLRPAEGETGPEAVVPRGGTLVVALANPVAAVEPVDIVFVEETEVFRNVFEPLLSTDAGGNLVPLLCERWEGRDGGRSFVLTLQPEARFQDGRPLTAADVKGSFERAALRARRNLPPALVPVEGVAEWVEEKADGIAGLTVLDDGRLEIRLREPLPIYTAFLSDRRSAVARPAPDGGAPLGTGPFRMTLHDRQRILLTRSDEYWRGRSANLEGIEYRLALSAAEIAAGLRSGEIDVGRDLQPEDLEEMLRDPRFRNGLAETPQKFTYFVLFNCRSGSRLSTGARRALAGVVRPQDLVWRNLGRFAQPAMGLLPPGILGHDPGRRKALLSPDEARALLADAGVTTPVRLRAAAHPLIQDRYAGLLRALLAGWAGLGVEVTIETPDMNSYLKAWTENEELDLAVVRWGPDYDDPDNFTHSLFHATVGELRSYYSSEETDRILEAARAEGRADVREGIYRKFDASLVEDAVLVPLFHDVDYRLAGPRVRGLRFSSIPPYVNYLDLGKTDEAAPAPEATREGGGVLHVPMTARITSLDPALSNTNEQAEVLPCIYETLLRGVGEARIVPWLAAEHRVEEGGRRHRIRLREDVRFHDGRRLTARDVRYSFERLLGRPDNEARQRYALIRGSKDLMDGTAAGLAGFHIHSSHELSFELERPVSFFPALLTYPAAAVVPEGTQRFGTSWREGSVGTGPFRVAAFRSGELVELERNPSYWRAGYPRVDGLQFHLGVAPGAIRSGFREGRFSLAADLFPEDVEALRRDPALAAHYREAPRLVTYFAAFNVRRGALADRDLRRRLARAVDVEQIVRQTLGRLAIPAHGLLPPGLLGHEPRTSGERPTPPPERVSGEGIELTVATHPILAGEYAGLFQRLTQAYREVGVRLRPVTRTMEEFVEAEFSGSVDISVGRWIADYADSDSFAFTLHSKEGDVGRMCGLAEADDLIVRGRTESDPAARHAIYRQLEEVLRREALVLPLFHEQAYRFPQPGLEGLSVSYLFPVVNYEELRFRGG